MDYYAYDFETKYDLELQSVGIMGIRRYAASLCSKEFGSGDDIYMLSTYGPDPHNEGKERGWVGHPRDFPWEWWREGGGDTGIVAHNNAFDWPILWRCVQLGYAPEWVLELPTFCSMDCCSAHQIARGLAPAVKALFDHELSKDMRNYMKGRSWEDAVREGKSEALEKYGLDDSEWCWRLWMQLHWTWSEDERFLSNHTRMMGWEGIGFDLPLAEKSYDDLDKKRWNALQEIPWVGKIDPKYKKEYPPTSKRGLAEECRINGIDPPSSTAEDSPEYAEWQEKYGKDYPFAVAMSTFNKLNVHAKRVRAMLDRVYHSETGPRMGYTLKYWGADTTARFSGDSGFNVQNMPRSSKFDVNMRHFLSAPEGYTYVICDKSQIEPRCLARRTEDWEYLKLLEEGYNPYEAHARLTMFWEGGNLKEEDPNLYLLAKIRVLQLGYGSGWKKFYDTVKLHGQLHILDNEPLKKQTYDFGTALSKWPNNAEALALWPSLDSDTQRHWVNAYVQVDRYRKSNNKIIGMWKKYDRMYNNASGDMEVDLLNGDTFKYFRIRPELSGLSCHTRLGKAKRSWFYGSKIVENIIQREARNCFAHDLVNLTNAGHKVVMHIHDEVIVECRAEDAESTAEDVKRIMSIPPSWLDRCPLEAEVQISKHYTK
jgi:hypothetical protein